jgi:hypothetical protein
MPTSQHTSIQVKIKKIPILPQHINIHVYIGLYSINIVFTFQEGKKPKKIHRQKTYTTITAR